MFLFLNTKMRRESRVVVVTRAERERLGYMQECFLMVMLRSAALVAEKCWFGWSTP